ncbi:MAG: TolC family protein, partial [Verrucomicrobiota bacterium]
QGSSEMVLSVVQPLLEGAGYHYNQSTIKIAKYDARMASAEFVRQLQSHLVEVNRAYWSLYYSRAFYLLSNEIVEDTQTILFQLEDRSDLDALESEVLRARAAMMTRRAGLTRAEMAIRNSEDRLRALVNDPDNAIGSNNEIVPLSRPIFSLYRDDVRRVAIDALRNRPEIQQGFDQLRTAVVRRDMAKNEKWPELNLVAELMLNELRGNDNFGSAFNTQFDQPGYAVGFQFEQPWDNDVDRAQLLRREIELRQQVNQLKAAIDTVLLESVVTYRELMTAYRDMQGRFEALRASREELRQLRDRLEIDTDEEGGRTTSSQLQLILDSMDRGQDAEEAFLDSVVAYNSSFVALERARGTLLKTENIGIERVRDTDPAHECDDLERLQLSTDLSPGQKGGSGGYSSHDADAYGLFSDSPSFASEDGMGDSSYFVSGSDGDFDTFGSDISLPSYDRDGETEEAAPAPDADRGLFARFLGNGSSSRQSLGSAGSGPASPPEVSVSPAAAPDVRTRPASVSVKPVATSDASVERKITVRPSVSVQKVGE